MRVHTVELENGLRIKKKNGGRVCTLELENEKNNIIYMGCGCVYGGRVLLIYIYIYMFIVCWQ